MSARHTKITFGPDGAGSDLDRILKEMEAEKRGQPKYRIVGALLWSVPFIVVGLLWWSLS